MILSKELGLLALLVIQLPHQSLGLRQRRLGFNGMKGKGKGSKDFPLAVTSRGW